MLIGTLLSGLAWGWAYCGFKFSNYLWIQWGLLGFMGILLFYWVAGLILAERWLRLRQFIRGLACLLVVALGGCCWLLLLLVMLFGPDISQPAL